MKLIVIKGNLKEGLGVVERCVSDNPNLPILKNIKIKTEDGRIVLVATNLEIATTCYVPGKVIEDGSLTVPFGAFYSLVSNLPTERINLEQKGSSLILKTDTYEGSVNGLPADDFPVIPRIENPKGFIKIDGNLFKSALDQVSCTAQVSDLRPELSSVMFDFSVENLKLVATDTFRLAEKSISRGKFTTNITDPFRALAPIKSVQEIIRVLKNEETTELVFDKSQILIKTDRFEIVSRLIEGVFPDYQHIIPKGFSAKTVVNRQEFLNSIKLVGITGSKNNEVKISISKNKRGLDISAKDQSLGEGNCSISAKIEDTIGTVAFNWRFLIDGLRSMDSEEVFMGLNEDKPSLIKNPKDSSGFYIIAPLLSS